MLVEITFAGMVDTTRQDKYLKEAIENIATKSPARPEDMRLVMQTFKARFDKRHFNILLINTKNEKQIFTPNSVFNDDGDVLNPF